MVTGDSETNVARGAALLVVDDACSRLESGETEISVDLSKVDRLDVQALNRFELLAARAQARSVKVELRGVNVDVYKVLKLVKLSQAFTFVN